MKKLFLFLVLNFIFFQFIPAQEKNTDGIYLVSQEGRFEVRYPLGFEGFKRTVNTKGKESTEKLIMFTTENQRGACLISFNEYDEETFEQKSTDVILNDAIDGYLKNNAKLLSSKNLKLGNIKGKSAIMASKSGDGEFYERFDVYVIKPRMYQIGFVGYTRQELDMADIQKYFKSFNVFLDDVKEQGYYLSSEEDGFEIFLPPGFTEPDKQKKPITTDYGDIDMTMYSRETKEGVCLIAVNEYPDKLFADKTTDKLLSDALGGVLGDENTKLLSKSEFYLDEFQGLEFITSSMAGKTKVYSKYHYIVNKPRLYQVVFMSAILKDLEKADVKDYFKSFKIK